MKQYKRVFLIVMDSLGVGAMPDAHLYGDEGSNTLASIANSMELKIPQLASLGLGNIIPVKNVGPVTTPIGFYTKMAEASPGKDTMTGHWEMMGILTTEPFMTFTDTGFPEELIKELEDKTGYKVIGNISASGTEIIKQLGEEHMKTKALIVYTSADSVLQIAMHEDIIPIDEQYRICEIARAITMKPEWMVGRVIARPFIGKNANDFKRTTNRHDYALKPSSPTVLNYLKDAGLAVVSVGKINDIFDGYGITSKFKTISNHDGMEKTINLTYEDFKGLVFVNLVDFDALYGHRRDPIGYGKDLEEFDGQLTVLMNQLKDDDLLILTADHGNDPCFKGTDHTREYVPLIVYSKNMQPPTALPISSSFADIGATISDNFKVKQPKIGKSLLPLIKGG